MYRCVGKSVHGSLSVWVRAAQCECVSLWVRGHAGAFVSRCVGERACGFRCVAVQMPRCVRWHVGSQVWLYRLVDKSVYGVRMGEVCACPGMWQVPRYVRGHAGVGCPGVLVRGNRDVRV